MWQKIPKIFFPPAGKKKPNHSEAGPSRPQQRLSAVPAAALAGCSRLDGQTGSAGKGPRLGAQPPGQPHGPHGSSKAPPAGMERGKGSRARDGAAGAKGTRGTQGALHKHLMQKIKSCGRQTQQQLRHHGTGPHKDMSHCSAVTLARGQAPSKAALSRLSRAAQGREN